MRLLPCALILVVLSVVGLASPQASDRVRVLPIVFTPLGERVPDAEQVRHFARHLTWARERYRELTGGRATFEVAGRTPVEMRGARELDAYRAQPDGGLAQIVSELFTAQGYDRFTCPYVFVVLVASDTPCPHAIGRPFNGGVNTGGGAALLSSFDLATSPHFQTTLTHELGHAFGLVHVDEYGYDQYDSRSIMSYDAGLLTRGFQQSADAARLLPEDLRALALNRRVFPTLTFDPHRDVLQGYRLANEVHWLEPMRIPGEVPHEVRIGTRTRSARRTHPRNALHSTTPSPYAPFDPRCMWHSAYLRDENASLEIRFPTAVNLTALGIHSQYGGHKHRVRTATLEARVGREWRVVAQQAGLVADQRLLFERVRSDRWRIVLAPTDSGHIVLRGLKFYSGETEVFPVGPPYLGPATVPAE
ncbi:MAG: hypothetical protein GY711_01745 [bacterium]|nr:hypothetical protein [bacterium]